MKAGSCIDVNHWSVWFPVPKSTDEVVPKSRREGKTQNKEKKRYVALQEHILALSDVS